MKIPLHDASQLLPPATSTAPPNSASNTPAGRARPGRSTEEFARDNLVKAASVRRRYCQTGAYHSVVPQKLDNGRLKWPA